MSETTGYIATFVAAVLFGIQYVPVKKYETYDGSVFQFFLCCGALFTTFWIEMGHGFISNGSFPALELLPAGLLGGAIWAVSNSLVIPLVKLMGLGVGFSMYHVVNLITGYCVGRFGMNFSFAHLAPDVAEMPLVRDLGVVVLVISFGILIIVEPQDTDTLSKSRTVVGSVTMVSGGAGVGPADAGSFRRVASASRQLSHVSISESGSSRGQTQDPYSFGDQNGLTPHMISELLGEQESPETSLSHCSRLLVAIPLALVSGGTCGLNAVPFAVWSGDLKKQHRTVDPFLYQFSQVLGIWVASPSIYLIFALAVKTLLKTKPQHSVIRPALLSGCFWAGGNILMLTGIKNIGFAAGYALDAVGPVLVASIIALFLGEVEKGKQMVYFLAAVVLQSVGVVMISVGNGNSH